MTIIAERWRPVPGKDRYFVSSHGRMLGPRGLLKISTKYGYPRACGQQVHKFVAEAFFGPRPKGQVICHGPEGHHCNAVWNLRYADQAENALDQYSSWESQGKKPSPILWPLATEYELTLDGNLKPVAATDILVGNTCVGVVGVVGSNPAAPMSKNQEPSKGSSDEAASGPLFSCPDPVDPHYTAEGNGVQIMALGNPVSPSDIARINRRLKEDGVRVQIVAKGPSLYLRAMYPSKDGIGTKQYKAKIPEIDIREADLKARKIGECLRLGTFSWDRFEGKPERAEITIDEFKAAARRMYESKYDNESSWGTKFKPALNKLPVAGTMPVSEKLLVHVVQKMPENSAARRDQGNVLSRIAYYLKMDGAPIQEAARGYSAKELKKRDLPSDALIESIYKQIQAPQWRWMFGMCATYGLRPHEIVECLITEDGNCEIGDETKTGFHVAWPCNERWVETFNLREIHRPTQDKYTVDKAANLYLKVRGPMPFVLYDLRHAYAIRLFKAEVPVNIAARLMGHHESTHRKNYQRWFEGREVNELRHRYKLNTEFG